jgi:hypothetical protein
MSCCGNPRPPQPVQAQSKSVPVGTVQQFPISHQPTAHPGITPFPPSPEGSAFRPPHITSPQPVHSLSHLNGPHSPPPTASTALSMPPSPPSSGPQMGMFSRTSVVQVDPIGSLSPLRRPSLTYPGSGNQNILSTYQSSPTVPSLPPTDDGKMSVSIDFGERCIPDPVPRRVRTDGSWFRNYLLWRSECICTSGITSRRSNRVSHRRMARRVLLLERCNKFCIGLDQRNISGKFRPVSCTTTVDKSTHGAWRPKVPILRPDSSSVNGKRLQGHSFCHMGWNLPHTLRFKLFLEPRALRDQSMVDPRLPPIPVRKQITEDRVS